MFGWMIGILVAIAAFIVLRWVLEEMSICAGSKDELD
jgi:hypothetical protein